MAGGDRVTIQLDQDDTNQLVEILADQAVKAMPVNPSSFFAYLVQEANLPRNWLSETYEVFAKNPDKTALALINWALNKGVNTQELEFQTLGSILHRLLKSLGEEKREIVIELMIRYELYKNHQPLIQVLIDNPSLQNVFAGENHQILIAYVRTLIKHDTNPISSELIEDFIQILMKIENFVLVADLLLASAQDARQMESQSAFEITLLKNAELKVSLKVFVLLKLLLEDIPYQGDRIEKIVEFSRLLKQNFPTMSSDLAAWLKEIDHSYGYQLSSLPQPQPIGRLEAYLMVVIRPAARGKYRITSCLRTNYPYEGWIDEDCQNVERKYDPNACTLKNAESYVEELILHSMTIVRDQKIKANCENDSLTIEFFMPYALWYKEVDQWKIPDIDGTASIGREFSVAVRSYERIAYVIGEDRKEYALLPRRLEEKWKIMSDLLEQCADRDDIKAVFSCFCQGSQIHDIQLLEESLEEEKVGLKLSCTPPKTSKDRDAFFKVILKTGIPVAIWLRQDEISGVQDLEAETDKFLKREYLSNHHLLLEKIKNERRKNRRKKDSLGKHLAILCDDPKRLPAALTPLTKADPLSLNG